MGGYQLKLGSLYAPLISKHGHWSTKFEGRPYITQDIVTPYLGCGSLVKPCQGAWTAEAPLPRTSVLSALAVKANLSDCCPTGPCDS
jgi:hypothetical protein